MKVRLTHPAKTDFAGILDSVADENLAAARRLGRAFAKRFKQLGRHSLAGERCAELIVDLRRVVVEPYVIYYRVTDQAVEIVRILHGARDHGPLLDE